MYFCSTPQAGYPTFGADTFEQLDHQLTLHLRAKIVEAPTGNAPLGVVSTRWKLPNGEIWFSSSDAPFAIALPDGDYVRVQFCQQGSARVRGGQMETFLNTAVACVTEPMATLHYSRNFRQYVWRIRKDALVRRLVALTGRPHTNSLIFEQALRLNTAEGERLRGMLECLLHCLSLPVSLGAERMLADLEAALTSAFLFASRHGASPLLHGEAARAAPWQVRRAEAYMEANFLQAISIEDIVVATGVSARSLFRTFREHRGYSPQAFLRQLRMRHADELLRMPGAASVTDVAFACGFSDLSRFSREFAKAFGATPSKILRQSRAES